MDSLGDRLGDAVASERLTASQADAEHPRLVLREQANGLSAQSPLLGEISDRIVPLKRRVWRRAGPKASCRSHDLADGRGLVRRRSSGCAASSVSALHLVLVARRPHPRGEAAPPESRPGVAGKTPAIRVPAIAFICKTIGSAKKLRRLLRDCG